MVVQPKPISKKIECAQRRILRAVCFKKKIDSMIKVSADHKFLNVFEFFMVEVIQELFKPIKFERNHLWNCLKLLLHANQKTLGGQLKDFWMYLLDEQ